MPSRKLDGMTLERIAETICGSGPDYSAPGPYRTMSDILRFFMRADVGPSGQSSTRKWFVLESLQALNDSTPGSLVARPIEQVLLRLAAPQENNGDVAMTQAVIGHLNRFLLLDGLKIVLRGVQPQIEETTARVAPPEPVETHVPPPDFPHLVSDSELAEILTFRWAEAQRCVSGKAHLAAVVMMGSILEGVLLHRASQNMRTVCTAKSAPKDKGGSPKAIHDWSLASLIDVAHEVGWLQGDVKRFSHALRESRNMVHPWHQRLLRESPDEGTCAICWQVVRAAVDDLLETDKGVSPP